LIGPEKLKFLKKGNVQLDEELRTTTMLDWYTNEEEMRQDDESKRSAKL
jgi:hypothetical protein